MTKDIVVETIVAMNTRNMLTDLLPFCLPNGPPLGSPKFIGGGERVHTYLV